MNYTFEYDELKSLSNKIKHGIDFETAKRAWEDEFAIEVPVKYLEGEKRFLLIGMIHDKVWTIVFTYRQECMRIISARRSRKEEVDFYEKHYA